MQTNGAKPENIFSSLGISFSTDAIKIKCITSKMSKIRSQNATKI